MGEFVQSMLWASTELSKGNPLVLLMHANTKEKIEVLNHDAQRRMKYKCQNQKIQ
jgi:hypothetical protein